MNEDGLIDRILEAFGRAIESGEQIDDQTLSSISAILRDALQRQIELPPEEEDRERDIVSGPSGPIEDPVALLWILSGGDESAFVNYLRTYPDAQLNAILRNPDELKNIIQKLKSTVTQSHGEVSEGIPKAGLNSSNIYGFAYDPSSKTLRVKFQGNDGYGAGPVYQYQGVPPQIFKMFRDGAASAKTTGRNQWGQWWKFKSPSLGSAMHSLIKMGGYPYSRIS